MIRLVAVMLAVGACSPVHAGLPRSGVSVSAPPVYTPTEAPPTIPAPAVRGVTLADAEAAPQPTPTPTPRRVRTSGCGGWRDLIARYFPPSEVDRACKVMMCESSGRPDVVSATRDHGLFQANEATWRGRWSAITGRPWVDVYDPEVNVGFAAWLWARDGWRPWVCRRVL